jgi:hypothetical protein
LPAVLTNRPVLALRFELLTRQVPSATLLMEMRPVDFGITRPSLAVVSQGNPLALAPRLRLSHRAVSFSDHLSAASWSATTQSVTEVSFSLRGVAEVKAPTVRAGPPGRSTTIGADTTDRQRPVWWAAIPRSCM